MQSITMTNYPNIKIFSTFQFRALLFHKCQNAKIMIPPPSRDRMHFGGETGSANAETWGEDGGAVGRLNETGRP